MYNYLCIIFLIQIFHVERIFNVDTYVQYMYFVCVLKGALVWRCLLPMFQFTVVD